VIFYLIKFTSKNKSEKEKERGKNIFD